MKLIDRIIISILNKIILVIYLKNNDKRIKTIKNESGLYNINVDCNSKEGKMLIEVVEKESSLKKGHN